MNDRIDDLVEAHRDDIHPAPAHMKQQWHDRVQDYLAGSLTPEQTAELETALRDDPHLRELYLKYAALDVALENQAEAELWKDVFQRAQRDRNIDQGTIYATASISQ